MVEPVSIAASGAIAGGAIDHVLGDNRTDDILREILTQVTSLAHYSEVERERTLYPINLIPSRATYYTRAPLRVAFILASGAPGDEIALQVGTGNLFTWINVSGDPVQIPAPVILTGDITVVDITTPAATDWRVTLFAHHESAAGMDKPR